MSKKKIPLDIMKSFVNELDAVKPHSRSMLVITQGVLELLVNVLAEKSCVNGDKISADNRTCPYSVKLTILNEMKIIDSYEYTILNTFRDLRNEAAHGYEVEIT